MSKDNCPAEVKVKIKIQGKGQDIFSTQGSSLLNSAPTGKTYQQTKSKLFAGLWQALGM